MGTTGFEPATSCFIGMSLERDLQTTGVGIESEIRFGTLSTFSDTLVVLHVPWSPTNAYPYEISSQPGTNNPLDPGGTCGSFCIDFDKDPGGAFDLKPGDIARLQIVSERRIILVTDVVDNGSSVELTFAPDTLLLHFEAAFAGAVQLGPVNTKGPFVLYWGYENHRVPISSDRGLLSTSARQCELLQSRSA